MALGLFDETLRAEGWFDETALVAGWFDESLIPAGGGGPATITGTLAATDAADTAAMDGLIAHVGALAATDSADTAAFAGLIAHVGTLSATDGADSFAGDGTVTSNAATITGTLAATDAPDTAAFVGTVEIPGVVYQPSAGAGGGGYLVELDGKRKQETIHLYDEEQEIMEILAAIVPVIELNQRVRM